MGCLPAPNRILRKSGPEVEGPMSFHTGVPGGDIDIGCPSYRSKVMSPRSFPERHEESGDTQRPPRLNLTLAVVGMLSPLDFCSSFLATVDLSSSDLSGSPLKRKTKVIQVGANKDGSRPDNTPRNFSHRGFKGIYGGRSSVGHQVGRAVGLGKPFL